MDNEGFLYIKDRAKDIIIVKGENVSSISVENALYRHPSVRDCAVVAVPDEASGERVGAIVVPKEGTKLDEAELIKSGK